MLSMEANDKVEELDKEWIELIQVVINLEIPIQEIKNFVSDYKRQ
ncbi:anti-repressor SinI family protein [Peribacillus simplex]